MSALAPTLEGFFTERLIGQRHASPNTVAAYRDAWRLLLRFVHARTGKEPCQLDLSDLDAPLIGAFLDHLEQERHNSVRTRNARLAAIRSFFHYAALRHPEHAALISRVLAIPTKRCQRTDVCYLTEPEIDAVLATAAPGTVGGTTPSWTLPCKPVCGYRSSPPFATRTSTWASVPTSAAPARAERNVPRPCPKATVAVLRVWMQERGGEPGDPLFPTRRGTALGRGAIGRLVAKHATVAAQQCPSLRVKRTTPHVLRHSTAMQLLRSGTDTAVIALWLGHERVDTTSSTYLHADLSIKERALARTAPPNTKPGRYRPSDRLLAFLNNL